MQSSTLWKLPEEIIQGSVVADIKDIPSFEGWRPKITGSASYFRQHFFFTSNGGIEFDYVFTAGDIYLVSTGNYSPGVVGGEALIFRIHFIRNYDLFFSKNRPGFFTGNSSFTHIGPLYIHYCPPCFFLRLFSPCRPYLYAMIRPAARTSICTRRAAFKIIKRARYADFCLNTRP